MISVLQIFVIGIFYAAAGASYYNSKIIFYHGSKFNSYPLNQAEELFDNSNFIKSRPTLLYFHGWQSCAEARTVKTIVSAYIENNGFNILILDWERLASKFYLFAISDIPELGMEVAKFILKMTSHVPINKIHLVGHSLGAHLAGHVGKCIKSLTKNSLILPRISGLDPAALGFYFPTCNIESINESDASMVDIIHSNAGHLGTRNTTGTVDFWPNSGRTQPGCWLRSCSHARSIDLWAESVANKGKVSFTSENVINSTVRIQMGLNCPTNAQPGNYKLYTNSKSPYSLG